jgi:membrane fusion protein (multidrug efflux system)
MNARRILIPLVNLIIFVAAGLVLFKLGNGHSSPAVAIDTADETTGPTDVPVHVTTVSRQMLRRMLTAYGDIEAAPPGNGRPAGCMTAGAPFAGIVGEVECVEGQRVKVGAVLFTMDSRAVDADIRQARSLFSAGQTALNDLRNASTQQSTGWMELIATWESAVAQANVDRAAAQRDLLAVKASISGIVQSVQAGPGETVSAGRPVVEIVDPDQVVLALQVPGFLAREVKIGQIVVVDMPNESHSASPVIASPATQSAQPSPIESQVQFVDPAIEPATGLASVDVALAPGSPFKLGQFVRADIVVEQRADCLAVPAESVIHDAAGRAEIGVVSADERQAVLHPVDTGIRQGDLVQVQSEWLQPGVTVVTVGASALITRTGIQVVGR